MSPGRILTIHSIVGLQWTVLHWKKSLVIASESLLTNDRSDVYPVYCVADSGRRWVMTLKTRKPCYRKDDHAMCYENFRVSLTTPTATFPEIFNGLVFRSVPWMCVQNMKFVALPVLEVIGGTPQNWAPPGYAHAPFTPKLLMGFCSDGRYECPGQMLSPYIPWISPERGYPKNVGSPRIHPRTLFFKIFNGLLFGWTL